MVFLHTITIILTIIFGFMVAFSTNPMNSIIFLIGIFFNSFIILFYFSIEFLGLIFILIYVGAIAILFLFVIMMLNLKSTELNLLNMNFISKIFLTVVCIYFIFFIIFNFFESFYSENENFLVHQTLLSFNAVDNSYNLDIVGQTLFNYFAGGFLVAGLILLIALLGAIVLAFDFNAQRNLNRAETQLSTSRPTVV